jgi:putative transposase
MRIQNLNHSTYQHQYHVVWATKYRRKILKPYVVTELKRSLWSTVKRYPTLWILTMNTDEDHVHIQIEIAPNTTVSDAIGKLKSYSSRHLKQKFKFINDIYIEKDGIWSVGYFSSTIGLNEAQIKRYIVAQGKKDKPQRSRLF